MYRNTNFSNCKIKWIEVFFVISSVPERNYLFKVSNWSTKIRCSNCSILRMKTLERCRWRHLMSLLLTVNIFQTLFNCWLCTSKRLLEITSRMSCVILEYFQCEQNLSTNSMWWMKNSCKGFYLHRCGSHSKCPSVHLFFLHILLAGRLIRS